MLLRSGSPGLTSKKNCLYPAENGTSVYAKHAEDAQKGGRKKRAPDCGQQTTGSGPKKGELGRGSDLITKLLRDECGRRDGNAKTPNRTLVN